MKAVTDIQKISLHSEQVRGHDQNAVVENTPAGADAIRLCNNNRELPFIGSIRESRPVPVGDLGAINLSLCDDCKPRFSDALMVDNSTSSKNGPISGPNEGKKIKQVTNLKKGHLYHSNRTANSIFRSKLVRSIRDSNANLTKITKFEVEDMKRQRRIGEL